MKQNEWNEGLNNLDSDIIENYVAQKEAYIKKIKKPTMWTRYISVAAAVCLVFGVLAVSLILNKSDDEPDAIPETEEETTTECDAESLSENVSDGEDATVGGIVTEDTLDTDEANTTNSSSEESSSGSASLDHINNGVLKDVYSETMAVPENMKYLGTVNATEDNNSAQMNATVVMYLLDGDVVNWKTENDLVYVITKGNNRLVVIDSENMTPIYNVPLAGIPAEMNFEDDKIYISMPDLCRIDVFSKSDCTKTSSIYFDHEVSSFALDGNYIYYSEHDQHCRVFRKDLSTGASVQITTGNISTFYFPKIYLNKEDRILYIGETRSTGCDLYYFDADTLKMNSVFKKNDYGIFNNTRELFHFGDEVFWGSYRLSDTNAKEIIGKYGTQSSGSITFVSEEMVSTYEGLFLTDTYECIIDYFDAGFDFEYMLVSESYNVFFRSNSGDKNIIIGVNFEIQETPLLGIPV